MSAQERAVEVLAAHAEQRVLDEQEHCVCGWDGTSQAEHQAEALSAAGLLPTDQDQRETRTEWALRRPSGAVAYPHPREEVVRLHRRYEYSKTTVVRREVGPWVEAPDPSP